MKTSVKNAAFDQLDALKQSHSKVELNQYSNINHPQGYHWCLYSTEFRPEKQAFSNSRARKVDQKVLQEQFLCTSGRWCMHLTNFSEIKNTFLIFFCNFEIFEFFKTLL